MYMCTYVYRYAEHMETWLFSFWKAILKGKNYEL